MCQKLAVLILKIHIFYSTEMAEKTSNFVILLDDRKRIMSHLNGTWDSHYKTDGV